MADMEIVAYEAVENVTADVDDETIPPMSEEDFCKQLEDVFTPYIGMEFGDIEEAITFYKVYALGVGFDVRKYTTKKWRDSTIKSKLLLNIGATRTYRMCKEVVNGFHNIGASLNDFKNFQRDIKCFIHERDGQLFIDHFKSMAETRPDFYFDYDVDVDGSLRRAIWADGNGRRNYSVFVDAVSYDPTYSTNKYKMVFTPFTGIDNHKRSITFCCALIAKETTESFNWVFERLLIAMGGKEPVYIITDQDPGIIASVPETFKTARHRFCMWHIMNKVPCKYGSKRKDYQVFLKKLNAIVWDEELEAEEFDNRWSAIMEEHIPADIEWFMDCYDIRRQWVMAHWKDLRMGGIMRTTQRSESENSFFKRCEARNGTLVEFWMRFESALDQQRHNQKRLDNENRHSNPKLCGKLAIESDGAKIYTHDIFEEFQEELKNAIGGFSCKGFLESNNLEVTTLKDSLGGRNFDVQDNLGLLCRHIIWIYSGNGVKKIPESAIARRWTKDALRSGDNSTWECTDDMDILDSKQLQMTKLWSEIHETIGVLVDKEKEDVEGLTNLIREFREKSTPVGSGKRILSSKAKAIAIASKPKRMCNNCKQMAHHDKRNCPNPFAEHPPQLSESSEEEEEEEEEVDDLSEE
ncbi:protein FAR-RED IMPAIRED RESPONSE 1-like [Silene latifolia]|uniref:protein FAR-RED IMPAIRED RESPONSE 1-like n=1 Tax=Silene latifolia TaxID=37657 RepID=UPI003D786524